MNNRFRFGLRPSALVSLLAIAASLDAAAFGQTTRTTTTTTTTSQSASAVPAVTGKMEPMTPMETLVARFALYPDDLVALVVPAATYPLQVVDAARYLDKRKADPKLPVPESWDDSVKSLVNYPDVIKIMNNDLEWTQALNDAIVTNQSAVLDAVQTYRRKVMAAGNLKSDQKQTVTVKEEVVSITPADPQVIYVPQYEPSTMVVYGGYSSWGYYGGYPSYYYPYPPGAALATGLIWGAAIGAIWGGGRYGYNGGNNNINIDNDFNVGTGDRNFSGGNRGQDGGRGAGSSTWKPSNKASTAGGGRIGDPGARGGASAGNMDRSFGPSAGGSRGGAGSRGSAGAGTYGPQAGGSRGGTGASAGTMDRGAGSRGSAGAGTYGPQAGSKRGSGSYGGGGYSGSRGSYGGSAFGSGGSGGYGSRNSASSFSSRGAASRGGGGRRR